MASAGLAGRERKLEPDWRVAVLKRGPKSPENLAKRCILARMTAQKLAFGPFVLDLGAGALSRHGAPVPISYRGLLLLTAFLKKPGESLSKSDLMEAAWPGLSVEESNLSVQIASLRKLLGATPDGSDWIATAPRFGYRFAGAVEPLAVARRG